MRTKTFKSLCDRLPKTIQRLAVAAFQQFCKDPNHPALRRHKLDDNDRGKHRQGSISVSINLQYRAIYVEDGKTNVWYWIGNHNDYEAFTGKK